ncbi:crotonase/enoyl-CoA hydratase family protein [Shewanella canadensis]|uniref:Crotonase/enoyl-CoA hydratase family protein n=1 Tax=Shewanella canadensis TaxID=271096 RepID=A0A3S0KX59_9GAMM|nr:crotonase/enoyl-CoA hydratase family protein [Shewanella canadensis]RTR40533.1 crotonase/enoyl-CoA hydratase family protein [Shewanella canadensis]
MARKYIKLQVVNGVAQVVIDRPDKYNALNFAMFKELDDVISELRKDLAVRVVILSGAGGNFSSGLDVKSVIQSPIQPLKLLFKWLPGNANLAQRVSFGWRNLPIPVIAVLEGCCFGGGMQIALGADIRIAAEDAKLSIMEAKWGLVPDMAGLVSLRELVGKDQALLLTMTAKIMSARESLDKGLITQVDSEPMQRALALASEIASTSPDANAAIKMSINRSWGASVRSLLSRESISQIRLLLGGNRIIAAKRQSHKAKSDSKPEPNSKPESGTKPEYKQRQAWW